MNTTAHIAKHIQEVFFGGNWTASCLQKQLADVDYQKANKEFNSCNSILKLTYHIAYYLIPLLQVLKGSAFDAHDKFSFDHLIIDSQDAWIAMQDQIWKDVHELISLVESLPDEILDKPFFDKKYGTYYRNLSGFIEHTHYHLGQIAILKKIS